ncbi:hypothetical protein [Ekhidna sp.]
MNLNRNFIRLGQLCLLSLVSVSGWSQENAQDSDSVLNIPTSRYLTLGVGSMAVQLNDEHMSPLNYYGSSMYLQLGAFKRKKKTLRNLTIGLNYSTIGARGDNREIDPRGQYFRIDLAYAQQYYIRSFWNGTTRWYVGGKIRSHSNVRMNPQLDGAFITFLFTNGLFASSVLEREVRISKKPLTVSWQLDLPIINHTIRPSYLNIYDFVNPENDWVEERLDDSKWRSITSFTNVTSTISLLYPISTSNVLRFSYEWDFYHIDSELKATNATHTYLFSFLFHF